ncbi:MAG: NAD(P)/FAD-dependent oxidoreductase [Planctomycetales bacterium]
MHSALARLGPQEVVQWFADAGVPTKREETGKIFPVSDTAVDVQQAMLRQVEAQGCRWEGNSPVERIDRDEESELFKLATPKGEIHTRQVVITTGGKSYPGCGTTGDGYAWARGFGHTIIRQTPALVPLLSSSTWCSELSGVTLPDVAVGIVGGGERTKVLSKCRDSFLFLRILDSPGQVC